MKKSLLALAALTAFAGVASAQSSVTLFGIVDLAARGVDNGIGTRTTLTQDGNSSSRLGFRGVEDLGGGLKAGFWIEGAVGADVGQSGGQTWQRRSTVSLMGGFGEIRLGRDYTPTFWNHTVFDPFGTNGVGSQTNLMVQQGAVQNGSAGGSSTGVNVLGGTSTTLVRADNTLGYFLPSIGGLYGQVQLALGEGAVGNEYMGGRIGYAAGPVNVAVAYGETQDAIGTADMKAFNVGASFNMGFMTLFGQYHEYKAGSAKLVNYMGGLTVPLGAMTLKASYGMTNLKPIDRDATQIAVGVVYDVSKRTALYVHASQVDNDAGLRFVAGGGGKTNGVGGFKSTGYELGIRHSF
ncbi:MAG TPA: porin [Rubrivivax sp.]|nr:porin [Rubrivivax sp.]